MVEAPTGIPATLDDSERKQALEKIAERIGVSTRLLATLLADPSLLERYYTHGQVATRMGITGRGLDNRISEGKNHPPFIGRGKDRLYPKDEFHKWEKGQLVHERKRRAS